MRQAQVLNGIVIGGAVALLATQPAWAAATQVTAVRLDPSENQLKLILDTQAGDELPQVSTANRGNDLVADIVNTRLKLKEGDSFRQENPLPGITALVVSQLDANSVRVTVSGTENPPSSQIIQSEPQGITLGINAAPKNQAIVPSPVSSSSTTPTSQVTPAIPSLQTPTALAQRQNSPTTVAQTPQPVAPVPSTSIPVLVSPIAQPVAPVQGQSIPATPAQTPQPVVQGQSIPATPTQTPQPVAQTQTPTPPVPTVVPPPVVPAPAPDVLVPNPKITIDGVPAPAAGAVQPVAPAPPFLPRAIAPPVGDIAISNINATAGFIDLGTGVRVPRLVLREAPVREVLSLLARSAGLNIAYIGDGGAAGAGGAPGAAPGGAQRTISLDLENEPVQNVFNYVLQISGLQANRVGNTILVGTQLPDTARNLVSRTLRLNQTLVGQAVGFLISQGAEQQQVGTQTTITVVGEGAAAQRIQNTTTTVQRITPQEAATGGAQGATGSTGALVLRGLLLSPDERLNAITLLGEPRKVEIATALLTQLDLRRRQVAVNVKIVDINLLGTDAFNSSFSFGIGNAFFVSDGGAAVFNYGGLRPPTAAQTTGSTVSPPVISNPFANASVFLDPNTPLSIPGPGTVTINPSLTGSPVTITPGPDVTVFGPRVNISDPLTAGITSLTPSTNTIVTRTPGTNGNPDTITVTQGQNGTVQFGLPSIFQFPQRLLTALQAQITSGNAKILTDPTLVVQESQTATVNLTQEVFGGFRLQTQTDPTTNLTTQVQEPIIKNAGLTLQINVQRIDDNGFITLTVIPIVSAISGSQNTPQGQITLVSQRQLQSGQVRLRDGQTLILSGIIQETDRTTVSKVPILGDIPLLGALFRSTSRDNSRQEVIVLLTPQILDDSAGSSFGYNYTPGQEARQILQRTGAPAQGNN
jgi:type IV pilus assembly protein PilQ